LKLITPPVLPEELTLLQLVRLLRQLLLRPLRPWLRLPLPLRPGRSRQSTSPRLLEALLLSLRMPSVFS